MTVAELIDRLSEMPPQAMVVMTSTDWPSYIAVAAEEMATVNLVPNRLGSNMWDLALAASPDVVRAVVISSAE